MNRPTATRPAMPRLAGITLLASLLFGLCIGPAPAVARDGQILNGKTALPLAYRFKKGQRYLPVAATLSALGVPAKELPKEATLAVTSPWSGQVTLLFRKGEVQIGGKVRPLSPTPIQRSGAWFITVGQMEELLGISATLTKDNDLRLVAMTRLEQTPGGMFLRTGAPVTPKGFYLDNPPRYVIDLPGARLDRKHSTPYTTHEVGYSSIRLGQFEDSTARIVYDLTDPRWRSPLAGKTGLTQLTLGAVDAPSLLPSLDVRLGIATDGSGLVLDGLHAREATLERVSPTLLRITFDGALLSGAVTPYQHRTGLTDTGIRWVTLEPGASQTAVLSIELSKAAPDAAMQFDASQSHLVVVLKAPKFDLPEHPSLKGLKGRTVVIDPGHGGRWPGAVMEPGMVGPTRLLEKDFTLRMSIELQKQLAAMGINAILTRSTDTVLDENLKLDLPARLKIATDAKADLFVSVHLNSFHKVPSDALSGTEVYFNKAGDKAIANTIFERMASRTGRGGRGPLYGQLAVTKHASIPSVLVECAYLSNPEEYALLCDPARAYEKTLITGLAEGIVAVLTGDTSLPIEATAVPMFDPSEWMENLAEHQLLFGTSAPTSLRSGQTDLFSMSDGSGNYVAPPAIPLPTIPPPVYLPLPDRSRVAVEPRAGTPTDPEVDFGLTSENQAADATDHVESGSQVVIEEEVVEGDTVPGGTPLERRLLIFSLGS